MGVHNAMQQQRQRQKRAKHVQWDEEKLKETEKFRGQFQKIDEPKTPYRPNEESDEEMDHEGKTEDEIALEVSLNKAKANSQTNYHKKIDISELNARLKEQLNQFHEKNEMEDEEEEAARKRREEFKKKRAHHYNEFKMIQKMKQHHESDDD